MKRVLILITLLLSTKLLHASLIEMSLGPIYQVDITTDPVSYSYKASIEALYRLSYPILMGIRYNYQGDYQEIMLVPAWRLMPISSKFKIDLQIGVGLAKISPASFQYVFGHAGIAMKYFVKKAFISLYGYYQDMVVVDKALNFVNVGLSVGFYI